jgi:hypothetical protein
MDALFPGMNPYLEDPTTWPNLHSRLIVAIANFLGPQIRPKYRVVVEEAVYKRDEQAVLIGVPDVSIRSGSPDVAPQPVGNVAVAEPIQVMLPWPDIVRQRYLEIRGRANDVITVIEILSPVNKRGAGRQKYEHKRLEILESETHLVEIDLLHTGLPLPVLGDDTDSHYRILVSHSRDRPQAQLYPFNLQQAVPVFGIPLAGEDAPISVNLKPLLDDIYDLSGYDLDLDYRQDPVPSWSPAELQWLDQHLQAQRLR